jgi:hypothetical protein
MFDIRTSILAIVFAAAISSLASMHYTAKYKDGVYEQKIHEIEKAANEAIQKEKDRSLKTEHELIAARDNLEVKNAENEKRVKDLLAKYNSAVDSGVRLRDPGTRPSCQNAMPADSAAPANASNGSGAELSEEASRFLLAEAARADAVVNELNLCKAWVKEVKETLDKFNQNQDKP